LLIATRIPGRWGFVRYVADVNIPSPWNVVVYAVYEILSFLIGNVLASGAMGVGWILYAVGSVVGSLLMSSLFGGVFSVVFC